MSLGDGHSEASVRRGVTHVVKAVIPKLLEAHGLDVPRVDDGEPRARRAEVPPTPTEIERLAQSSVACDVAACEQIVKESRRGGRSELWVIASLIPAAARHLGAAWEDDRCSWTDVSVGVGMLQRLLRRCVGERPPALPRGLVVITCLPEEQHTLGVFILGEWLQRQGWLTHVEPGLDEDELLRLIEDESALAVALSVNHDELLEPAASLCEFLRSLAPEVGVLLGGAAELGAIAATTGAIHCADAADAVHWLGEHS